MASKYFWAGATLLVLLVFSVYDLAGEAWLSRAGRRDPPPASSPVRLGSGRPLPAPRPGKAAPAQVQVQYSRNWAGAINADAPSGRFAAAKMTFTLPRHLGPDVVQPRADYYAANAWVGIDGRAPHAGALLQTGVIVEVNRSRLAYRPWYEWWPEPAVFLGDLALGPGDEVRVEAVMFNATMGKVVVENLSRGEWAARKLAAPRPEAALAGRTVEWVLEDFKLDHGPNVPFGDFGTLELRDCVAYTDADQKVGPDPSQPFWIRQNNLTRARSAVHGSSVTIEYNRSI